MRSYAFGVETVTPLLIGGAQAGASNPVVEGLRPPAARGQMRWWFRAVASGVLGGALEATRGLEMRVFGATERSSPFALRSLPFRRVTHKQYGVRMWDGERPGRSGIPPGQGTTLVLQQRRGETEAEAAIWSLWLAIMLGGFGARNRRGFGSIRVVSHDCSAFPLAFSYPDHQAGVVDLIGRALRGARTAFGSLAESGCHAQPRPEHFRRGREFEILAPDERHCRIWVVFSSGDRWSCPEDAFAGMRALYREIKKQVGAPETGPHHRAEIGHASPRDPSPLILQIKATQSVEGAHPAGLFGLVIALDDTGTLRDHARSGQERGSSIKTSGPKVGHRYYQRCGLDGVSRAIESYRAVVAQRVYWS